MSKLQTHIKENQRIIDLLYRCREKTDNPYKKKAYDRAINEIHSYWHEINRYNWNPKKIGESISRRIEEFLMGIPEEDIVNS
jgi:hypothetical protein